MVYLGRVLPLHPPPSSVVGVVVGGAGEGPQGPTRTGEDGTSHVSPPHEEEKGGGWRGGTGRTRKGLGRFDSLGDGDLPFEEYLKRVKEVARCELEGLPVPTRNPWSRPFSSLPCPDLPDEITSSPYPCQTTVLELPSVPPTSRS